MNADTSIEARFEGHEIIEHGMAQIPNLLLLHYYDLGLSDGQYTILSHIIARKWTKEAPYPTLTGLKMSTNVDTRRRYVRDLRQKGLLFTTRRYWTAKDLLKNPLAHPGKVRSNLWYLSSLLHNLVCIHRWVELGKDPADFQIEIPLPTVKMFLSGEFHDTPESIAKVINEQTQNGTVLKAVLLPCENRIVGFSTMRFSSTRKTSTRKSHSLKEESVSNKNQPLNKNQPSTKVGASAPALIKPKKVKASNSVPENTNSPAPMAVEVYRQVARRYPDQVLWEEIQSTVGNTQDKLDFWKEIIIAYIGCGWNKLNINGMLAFFRRGQLPTTQPVAKNGGTNGTHTQHSPGQQSGRDLARQPTYNPFTKEIVPGES